MTNFWAGVLAGALIFLVPQGGATAPGRALAAEAPVAAPPAPSLLDKALQGPLAGVEEVVFAARPMGHDGHWYANFSYYGPDANRKAYREGGRLCLLNLRSGQVRKIFEDPKGGVRDPVVHYDGRKILFAYRKAGTDPYHLCEVNVDGSGFRQLTDGPYDDFEPAYLPDGDIVFVSSRCKRWVNCWLTQVAIMYRCGPGGENVRPISSNNDHDNTPWVLPDGRLLYMRWEYVDRSQVHFHHLWTSNPDGTGQMVYFGNMHPGIVMIDAKPIPGTDRVVSIFSPGHGIREHNGVVTVVDPNAGPDHQPAARTVNPHAGFRDPYAFSEDCFLVAGDEGLYLMDGRGATQLLARKADGLDYHEPRPLVPRPRERVIPARVDPARESGRLVLADVTAGRNMAGVKPGEVTKLLVLETLPMPVHFSGGMEPMTLGGTFILERILGTVPVEPDGSAYFDVPAMRSVFFVAMDAQDNAIKRMQSFVNVQPGEVTGCVGCHEQRTQSLGPRASGLAALKRAPSRITPVADVPDVFDFPRDIQPILDAHCVTCHNPDKPSGGVSLAGDRGPLYSQGYFNLIARGLVADGRNQFGNRPPRAMGAAASRLLTKISGAHHDVKVTDHERKMLWYWIESGAVYPGTYAAPGSGMVGGYVENAIQRIDLDWPAAKTGMETIARRCGGCHNKGQPLPSSATHDAKGHTRHLVYNLTRPEKSVLLLGPLAKAAGGYGTCQARTPPPKPGEKAPEVFADTADPDYLKILASIQEAKGWLDAHKRFDMPGFRPYDPYVREMKRYGILAESVGPNDPIDPYATDRAYWKSLWYQPVTQ
ncbi:MAG: PD40 domain-containing protein [Planctomycetes bacterium]|nr:PD40 domain-containing protein [Planctomycetota bacterium]